MPELVPKGAENYRPVITYRPAFAVPLAIVFGGVLVIVGISGLAGEPGTGVEGVVLGSALVLVGVFMAAAFVSTRLVVDPDKLVLRSWFQKKAIPWSDGQGFTVGMARTYSGGYKCLLVITGSGPVRINGVVGSKKFVEKKIAELEDVRRRYVKAA